MSTAKRIYNQAQLEIEISRLIKNAEKRKDREAIRVIENIYQVATAHLLTAWYAEVLISGHNILLSYVFVKDKRTDEDESISNYEPTQEEIAEHCKLFREAHLSYLADNSFPHTHRDEGPNIKVIPVHRRRWSVSARNIQNGDGIDICDRPYWNTEY